jgi:hypothetical protein
VPFGKEEVHAVIQDMVSERAFSLAWIRHVKTHIYQWSVDMPFAFDKTNDNTMSIL